MASCRCAVFAAALLLSRVVVAEAPTPPDYLFPDLDKKLTTLDGKLASAQLGVALIGDYTYITQNAVSVQQVGTQPSQWELRAARFVLHGELRFFSRPWIYLAAWDYNELHKPEDRVLDPYDLQVAIPLWGEARIAIGRQKEPFVYEMAADSASLPQQERILTPFFTNRNIGLRYYDNLLDGRLSVGAGVYNDWFTHGRSFNHNGTQADVRLGGLPVLADEGRHWLHVAVAARYIGPDEGNLRFQGRPESNVTDDYVDTGAFAASHATLVAAEAVYTLCGISLFGEYVHTWVSSAGSGNPEFTGLYAGAAWVLTGENRPYDKRVGFARRIIPRSRYGALELTARYSWLDLDSGNVHGGRLAKWNWGIDWWASAQWKVGISYGYADLFLNQPGGHTGLLLSRLQWIY